MELTEEPPTEKQSQTVKKYRDKRKIDASIKKEQSRRIERIRKLKVSCMAENQLSSYRAAARDRRLRNKKMKKAKPGADKSKYRTHYVKKTVKNTYKTLPRSPAERAEVLSKLAEQALLKLQAQKANLQRDLLQMQIKRE